MSELKIVNHYATLSAAIRAGAGLAPQGVGQCFSFGLRNQIHTCALGAAVMAMSGRSHSESNALYYRFLETTYPYMRTKDVTCPVPSCQITDDLTTIVFHLNDRWHSWTREAIADWLEQWENEHLGFETLTEEREAVVYGPEVQYAQCGN